MKHSWQQNRITEKDLYTIAQGAIEYWASGDWDFLTDFLSEGRYTTSEMESMMHEASDQLEDIVAQWLIKEKGLTVTGSKMDKQAWTVSKYKYTFITHTFAHYMGAHGESRHKITIKASTLFDAYCFKDKVSPEEFAEEMGFNINRMRASDEAFIKAMGDNLDNEEFAITILKDDVPLFDPEGSIDEDEGEFEVNSSLKFAKSPPGRSKQVEKLKEKGMSDDEAFGIAWNQYKKHGKPKKKKKSSLKFSWQGLEETPINVGDTVNVESASGHGTGGPTTVKEILTKFNPDDGTPYKIIVTKDGGKFDARTGQPVAPPWGYYIVIPGSEIPETTEHYVAGEKIVFTKEVTDRHDPDKVFPEGTQATILRVGDNTAKVTVDMGAYNWRLLVDLSDIKRDLSNRPPMSFIDLFRNRQGSYQLEQEGLNESDDKLDRVLAMRDRARERCDVFSSKKFSEGYGTFEWPELYLKDGMIVDYKGNQAFSDAGQPNFNSVEEAENWLTENNYRGNVIGDYNMKQASIEKKAQEEDYDFYNDNYRFNPEEEHICEDCGVSGAKLYNAFGQHLQIGGFANDVELCDTCHKKRFPDHWRYQKEGSMKKEADGVALNMLSALFEDKFPMHRVPAELRVLRAKAANSIKELVKHIQILGRDSTPPDFPMDWYYTDTHFATPNNAPQDYSGFVTEVRTLLQEIIDYANRSVGGKDFYSNMKPTITKISRDRSGVTILRELVDGKPYRYGYINEGGDYIELEGHKEVSKYASIYRPDTGTQAVLLGYSNIEQTTDDLLVANLIKTTIEEGGYDGLNGEKGDATQKPAEGFIPTSEGQMEPDDIVDYLTYLNYAYNRELNPDIVPERWAKIYGPKTDAMERRYQKEKNSGKSFSRQDITNALIKEAVDVSDEVPPMGWNSTEPGVPAGSGAPKPQMESLQSDDEKDQQKTDQGVLYDSTKDSGPQFQTTISPKDKSVTVKFIDSPEQMALHKVVEQKPGADFDQLPKLNTTPPQGGQVPGQETGPQQEPGKFRDQEVPVVF